MTVKCINDIFKLKPHDISKARSGISVRRKEPNTNIIYCGTELYKIFKKILPKGC
jgi:hypothetical protein